MVFWIIASAMALMVALVLGRAVVRGAREGLPARTESDLAVYRAQLDEVERDVARGVVPQADAEGVRAEIARRILALDGATAPEAARPLGGRVVPVLIAVLLVAGSLALYAGIGQPGYGDLALADRIAFAEDMRATRPSQEEIEKTMPPAPAPEGLTDQYAKLMDQLRSTVADRPDDLQGHVLLAENEANIGHFPAAARAQREVLRLRGSDATVDDYGSYAEYLILAAGGYVSPEAETALRTVLARDSEDPRARYFLGLMMAQTGRPDIAFRLWNAVLRTADARTPWVQLIRAQIMPVSQLAGVNYTLPPAPEEGTRGPSSEDIAAAADLTDEGRAQMIGGMVEGLSTRLATEGGPPEDWARLITSLAVLGQTDRARAIYGNALEVFADAPPALEVIRAAGAQAGVAE